jgi:peptidoglycan hydrolase-like protein with peptidoglycan-binding domain
MKRISFSHRSSIAAATALAAVLAVGTMGGAFAAGYDQHGAQQQQQPYQQQSANQPQSSQNQQHVREVQQKLMQEGHDVGSIDGQFGPKTQAALRSFQQEEGLQPSGQIDQQTLEKLGIASSDSGFGGQSSSSMSGSSTGSGWTGGNNTVGGALSSDQKTSSEQRDDLKE